MGAAASGKARDSQGATSQGATLQGATSQGATGLRAAWAGYGRPTRCPRARCPRARCPPRALPTRAHTRMHARALEGFAGGAQAHSLAHTAESTCGATVAASRGGGGMSPCTNGQPAASPRARALGLTGMEMLTGSRPRAGTLISGGMAAGCIESSTGGAVGGTACVG